MKNHQKTRKMAKIVFLALKCPFEPMGPERPFFVFLALFQAGPSKSKKGLVKTVFFGHGPPPKKSKIVTRKPVYQERRNPGFWPGGGWLQAGFSRKPRNPQNRGFSGF